MTNKFDEKLKQNNVSSDPKDRVCDEGVSDAAERTSNCSEDSKENSRTDDQNTENANQDTDKSEGKADENQNLNENASEEDANTKFLRLMADFQNYRKRVDKEKSDVYARANEGIMLGLLAVIDNFERALEHESKDEKYAEGMQLIFKQLMDVLQASGLEEIKALDEDFDPNIHNAVMTCDSDEHESGKVVEVLQKGYLLNGRLLRASMVKVSN